jgi:hypothetical protein
LRHAGRIVIIGFPIHGIKQRFPAEVPAHLLETSAALRADPDDAAVGIEDQEGGCAAKRAAGAAGMAGDHGCDSIRSTPVDGGAHSARAVPAIVSVASVAGGTLTGTHAIHRAIPGALEAGFERIERDGLRACSLSVLTVAMRQAVSLKLRAFGPFPLDAARAERYWRLEGA